MNDLNNDLVIAKYKDAIDKLEKYQAKEPDRSQRKAASRLISELRNKIMETAWNSIVQRTAALKALTADLAGITENASDVPSVSSAIEDISEIISTVSDIVKKH